MNTDETRQAYPVSRPFRERLTAWAATTLNDDDARDTNVMLERAERLLEFAQQACDDADLQSRLDAIQHVVTNLRGEPSDADTVLMGALAVYRWLSADAADDELAGPVLLDQFDLPGTVAPVTPENALNAHIRGGGRFTLGDSLDGLDDGMEGGDA